MLARTEQRTETRTYRIVHSEKGIRVMIADEDALHVGATHTAAQTVFMGVSGISLLIYLAIILL